MVVNTDSTIVREQKRLERNGVLGYLIGASIALTYFWAVPHYAKIYWPYLLTYLDENKISVEVWYYFYAMF